MSDKLGTRISEKVRAGVSYMGPETRGSYATDGELIYTY